jgi:hypothetical protein
MTAPSDETQPVRRNRAASIARDTSGAGGGAFTRMGFTDPALVLRWREIAGPEVARLCQPLRFSEGAGGGTLTLKALPGAALVLSHETRPLTARTPLALAPAMAAQIPITTTKRCSVAEPVFLPHHHSATPMASTPYQSPQ